MTMQRWTFSESACWVWGRLVSMMAAMPVMGYWGQYSAEGQTSSSKACPEAFMLDEVRFALEALSVLRRYKDWAGRHCCAGAPDCGMA